MCSIGHFSTDKNTLKINVIDVQNLFLTSIIQDVFFILVVSNNGRSSF
jgi:hypothetical protein